MKKEVNKIVKGQSPTSEERFYLEWGKQSLKENIKICNEILSKLITITIALSGGSIVQTLVDNPIQKTIITSIFVIALCLSILGYLPKKKYVDIDSPLEIKKYKRKLMKSKYIYVILSSTLIVLGLIYSVICATDII